MLHHGIRCARVFRTGQQAPIPILGSCPTVWLCLSVRNTSSMGAYTRTQFPLKKNKSLRGVLMCLRCPPGPILGAVPAFPVSARPVLGQLEKEEKEVKEESGRAGPGRRAGPTDSGLSCTSGQQQQCPPNTLPENCLFTTRHPPSEGTTTIFRPCLAS